MNLLPGIASTYGNFSFEASEGRAISHHFIDHSTKLLVVEETLLEDAKLQSRMLYVTTVDRKKGKIVSPEERKNYYSYEPEEIIDKKLDLRLYSEREFNPVTHNEFIKQKLFQLSTGKEISSSSGIAFCASPLDNLIARYLQQIEERKKQELFWKVEYPAKSEAEKVKFWAGRYHRYMRWQGEDGLDEYSFYDVEWLKEQLQLDPDFERIFKKVLDEYFAPYGWDVALIRKKIGWK